MFGKKRCRNCGEKVGDSYNYCPYCRMPLKDLFEDEEWGILGRNDIVEPEEIRLPMGLNALLNSLVKNLNKQLKEFDQEKRNQDKEQRVSKKGGGISISISTSGDKPPEIKVRSFGNIPEFREKERQIKHKREEDEIRLPGTDLRRFAGLPKKEPETDIRRFSNRVVYEIKMPGVKSLKDISITQLESSIEIKALADKKVFYKIIPINLPIRKYNLSKGVLVLELDSRE